MTELLTTNTSQWKKKCNLYPLSSSHHQRFQDILTLHQIFKEGLTFLFEWCWIYLDMCPCWRFIIRVSITLSNFKSLRNHKIFWGHFSDIACGSNTEHKNSMDHMFADVQKAIHPESSRHVNLPHQLHFNKSMTDSLSLLIIMIKRGHY